MEISQLRTLIHVAETGSLSKAADRMNIAQPALSRQVRMLEEKLGARLFIRHGRGMVLTDQGRDVLDHVGHVMAAIAVRQPDLIDRWPARGFDYEAVCPTSQATPRDATGCGSHAAAQQLDRWATSELSRHEMISVCVFLKPHVRPNAAPQIAATHHARHQFQQQVSGC